MVFKGYTYTNVTDAEAAVQQCDIYYSIPKSPDDITQHWAGFEYSQNDNIYFILFDKSLLPVLGEPVEFEVNLEEDI
jgi:hypothetical protein